MTPLRAVGADELTTVNALILAAITTWPVSAVVRERIAPSYCYDAVDLQHMRLFVRGEPADGMIAIEAAASGDAPATPALLLHGLYVHPTMQHSGLGRTLVAAALDLARAEHARGLLVKAQRSANGFFATLDFEPLPVIDPARDYPHRWWKPLVHAP